MPMRGLAIGQRLISAHGSRHSPLTGQHTPYAIHPHRGIRGTLALKSYWPGALLPATIRVVMPREDLPGLMVLRMALVIRAALALLLGVVALFMLVLAIFIPRRPLDARPARA